VPRRRLRWLLATLTCIIFAV
ncbi:hypothetical protein CCACVL1_00352, partial [Corchorus capsularis]